MDDVNRLHLLQKYGLKGEVDVSLPTSKSISNRLLIIQALSCGKISVDALSDAEDTQYLASALSNQSQEIFMGDGGTTIRFGLAWAAVTPGTRVLTGSDHLNQRPISQLVDALLELGADIEYLEHPLSPPLRVQGKKLRGGYLKLDGSMSSQFISALLLVSPYFKEEFVLGLDPDQVSISYIRMTYFLMKEAGALIEWKENTIKVIPEPYGRKKTISVEADWSGASYFYSWVALNPELTVRIPGLKDKSVQGDRICAKIYEIFEVQTLFDEQGVILTHRKAMEKNNHQLEIDCIEFPDLAQTIAITAAGLNQRLKLTGLQTLRIKETDRILALHEELAKCGVLTEFGKDFLKLVAPFETTSSGVTIATYNDHRMAMAFAPYVSKIYSLDIENPEVVSKSFPNYWEEVQKLGVTLV